MIEWGRPEYIAVLACIGYEEKRENALLIHEILDYSPPAR